MQSAKLVSQITSRKMKNLTKERVRLVDHYNKLAEISASNEISLLEKFQKLYEGIIEIGVYHPSICNLEHLVDGATTDEVIKAWIDKLSSEVQKGQAKQMQGFIYGSILKEYIKNKKDENTITEMGFEMIQTKPSEIPLKESYDRNSQVFKTILTPADPNTYDLLFLESFFQNNKHLETIKTKISEQCDSIIQNPVSQYEIYQAAETLITKSTLKNDLRSSLVQLQNNKILMNEYASEIQIMLEELDIWSWEELDDESEKKYYPSLFVKKFKNDKHRAFLDCSTINAIFIEIIGRRWTEAIRSPLHLFYRSCFNFKHQIMKQDPNTPYPKPGILRALTKHFSLIARDTQGNKKSKKPLTEYDGDNGDEVDENLIHYSMEDEKNSEVVNSRQFILDYLCTQIKLVKEVLPEYNLSIVQADIENCYPSIPHPVLLKALSYYGFNDRWISFFSKYLKATVTLPDGSLAKIERGVFLRHPLSLLFVEMIMAIVDISVKSTDKSQDGPHPFDLTYLRAVDDTYMWSLSNETTQLAWSTLYSTVSKLGMNLNMEKSSYTILSKIGENNEMDCDVSLQPPLSKDNKLSFGFLYLNSETREWDINLSKLSPIVEKLYQRIKLSSSVVGMANIYNSYIKYIEFQLGKCFALGKSHINKCLAVFKSINDNFTEKNLNIIKFFEREIQKRFSINHTSPEAWYYIPITAGGLGLNNPVLKCHIMRTTMREILFPSVSKDTQLKWLNTARDKTYTTFETIMSSSIQLQSPQMTSNLSDLIKTFTSRFDQQQSFTLSPYYQWILATYESQMLSMFGGYSFTSTSVVPVSLIMEIKS